MLAHPWLQMASNYETRLTKEEMKDYKEKKKDLDRFSDNENIHLEMSRLQLSEKARHEADNEMASTFSFSDLSNNSFFDDSDSLTGIPKKKAPKPKNGPKKKIVGELIKRDIAEGRTFNNSFTGPYPEDTDHLHIDKGANP